VHRTSGWLTRRDGPDGEGRAATVYLAHDLKHDRDVAIKVLHADLGAALGADRFLSEIRTTARLQHPHILPLLDSGDADGLLYFVMPLATGETLRARLERERQLPIDDAVLIAREVADALGHAHGLGVIHRDIKPENILLQGGHALVADFGIALAVQQAGEARMTQTGLSLGTPQYMSPEQAMGERTIDARSDIYALGAVTYEMLAGEPPHTGSSSQIVVMKVVSEEAPPLARARRSVPANVDAAVGKALAKLPADRFAIARAFADALADPHFGYAPARSRLDAGRAQSLALWLRNRWSRGAVATLLVAALAGAIGWQRLHQAPRMGAFAQKTFRSEAISVARFAADGQAIVYSSMGSEGTVPHLYVVRPDGAEPEPLGPDSTALLAVSSTQQLAVLTGARFLGSRLFTGTLATLPIGGGSPRELLTHVRGADWSPDGRTLAVVHQVDAIDRLEYPIATVLYTSAGQLTDVRVSPDGAMIAVFEHPSRDDDRGRVLIFDRQGRQLVQSPTYWALEGLAWSRAGREAVYSAGAVVGAYGSMTVQAMNLHGATRRVITSAGGLTTQDISRAGRVLVTQDVRSLEIRLRTPAASADRDAGWLNSSANPVLSRDGEWLALTDYTTGGLLYTVLLRKTDGSPAARLGDGSPIAFSRDSRSLLAYVPTTPARLTVYPTGAGSPRELAIQSLETVLPGTGALFADGKRALVCGNRRGERTRCFVGTLEGDSLAPVTPLGTTQAALSSNEELVAAQLGDSLVIFPLGAGIPRRVLGFNRHDALCRWSPDDREIWVYDEAGIPPRIDRIDLVTGKRSTLLQIIPTNRTGLRRIPKVAVADDPATYAYMQGRILSAIFVVDSVQ
jgi:hypothetical protein